MTNKNNASFEYGVVLLHTMEDKMQLSKRLQAVADLVTKGKRVADVGCDHAYTSIYLAKYQIAPRVIAMDINQGPIDRARENIIKYGCNGQIETRKSNGLEKLNVGEADTIIIAGMGGALMVQILTDKMDVVKSVKELVLQPQSEIHKVRQLLTEQEFIIIEENMLKEDGKYYVIMKAVPKVTMADEIPYRLSAKEHYHYGKLLLEKENAVLKEFLLWDLSICNDIQKALELNQSEQATQRLAELRERTELIHSGLEYFK
jgi:Predicted SAM-dependent methyltransferase